MKKKVLVGLLAAMVGVMTLTGCGDETSYSYYQIEAYFPVGTELETRIANGETLTEEEQQDLLAQQLMTVYLIQNVYVRTLTQNGGIVFEEDDEVFNDEQAIRFYETKVAELDALDMDNVMTEIKAADGSELTGTGTFYFNYRLRKGSTASNMAGQSKSYSVNY